MFKSTFLCHNFVFVLFEYASLVEFIVLVHLFKLSLLSVCFQKIIEDVEEMLNNLPGVTSVHGRFYDLSSKYYRIIGNHAAYYKDALRYLGCVDIKDLPGGRRA